MFLWLVSYLHSSVGSQGVHNRASYLMGGGSSWDELVRSPYAATEGFNLIQGENLVFLSLSPSFLTFFLSQSWIWAGHLRFYSLLNAWDPANICGLMRVSVFTISGQKVLTVV